MIKSLNGRCPLSASAAPVLSCLDPDMPPPAFPQAPTLALHLKGSCMFRVGFRLASPGRQEALVRIDPQRDRRRTVMSPGVFFGLEGYPEVRGLRRTRIRPNLLLDLHFRTCAAAVKLRNMLSLAGAAP